MAEISRRTLLSRAVLVAGLAAGTGFGLAKGVRHKVAVPPPAPPAALTDALAAQRRLLTGYDALGSHSGLPGAPGLRSDVTAHGDALRALLERYPGWRLAQAERSPAPTGSAKSAGTSVDQLAAITAANARSLTRVALTWPADEQHAAEVVPVLASIAASLASHAQVLA